MKLSKLKTLLALSLSAVAVIAAQQAQAGEFTLGAGVYTSKSEYKGFKDESGAMPLIEYQGEGWSIGASGVTVDLYDNEQSPLSVSALLNSAGSGFDDDDSDAFSGMKKRKASIDLGLQLGYEVGPGAIEASLLADVSSTHKGYVFDMNYSQSMPLMGGFFQPAAGFEILSEDFTDYYYGVKANEATATRAAYKADTAINPYLAYNFVYPVNDKLKVIHGSSIKKLDSDIKDSSIVDRSTTWNTFIGVGYTF